MNLEKAKRMAGGDKDNFETITFRINGDVKAQFAEMCRQHNLSIGRLMRAFVEELLEEAEQ